MASRVDQERARLIQLQIEKDETDTLLRQENEALERIMREHEAREQEQAQRKAEIRKAREELERAEKLEQATELSDLVDEGLSKLNERFESIAAGKLWYEGTGNNDAILPHQWQAVRFGAVARRWICGDGVGLGKTREAVGWLDLVGARKVVIVCEANICAQFAAEVEVLAPHREVVHLYNAKPYQRDGVKYSAETVRHRLLDTAVSLDEAVLVVNFEMWRRDKDALAKLMMWQADTVIVDEAHNLKQMTTKAFQNVNALVSVDNTCGRCGSLIMGLWDADALQARPSRKIAKPCGNCGWKSGDPMRRRTSNPLENMLQTRSVKNICLTTGTPILNSPLDLFSLLNLCNPVLFNTKSSFQTNFLAQNAMSGKWDFRSETALNMLKPLIAGIFIARTLADTDVVLPKQTVNIIPIEMDKESYKKQYKAIRQLTEQAQLQLDSGQQLTIMHLIALITRKRQANVWPGGIVVVDKDEDSPTFGETIFDGSEIDESIKMDTLMNNLKGMHEQGHRQIVFSQFSTGLREFEKRVTAEGIRAVVLDGNTPNDLRSAIKLNFNRANHEEAKWDVVLINYKTGGTGLNLNEATVTHILDEEWNPGKRDQAYGRTNRIGQTEENHVFVYRLRASVDTWMSNTIKRKDGIVEAFKSTMMGDREMAMDLRQAMADGSVM